jgi:hypothetical protein
MRTPARTTTLLTAALLLAGCGTSGHGDDLPGPTAAETRAGLASYLALNCTKAIGGDTPPADFTVVLDAVALPAAPRYPALQAAETGGEPALFAKTGLVVRAGATVRLSIPPSVGRGAGIGWGLDRNGQTPTLVVPGCPDLRGTGWLAFAGGYWADEPLCLPLDVGVGAQTQRVEIGIGTACPGQAAPPTA